VGETPQEMEASTGLVAEDRKTASRRIRAQRLRHRVDTVIGDRFSPLLSHSSENNFKPLL
jgi:DNA topoisomerase IA